MTAQTLMFFTLKDIAKLNNYCEATPYSHMWHVNVPTRRHVLGYIIIMTFMHMLSARRHDGTQPDDNDIFSKSL